MTDRLNHKIHIKMFLKNRVGFNDFDLNFRTLEFEMFELKVFPLNFTGIFFLTLNLYSD